MFPELPLIQDIAGSRCPVAPFAQFESKDMCAILTKMFNARDELYQLELSEYYNVSGRLVVHNRLYDLYGIEHRGNDLYDKNGTMIEGLFAYVNDNFEITKRKILYAEKTYGRYKDTYKNGFLKSRKYNGGDKELYFNYDINSRSVVCEISCRAFGERRTFIERYDCDGKLICQCNYSYAERMPESWSNATYLYYYENNRINQIIGSYASCYDCHTTRDVFTDYNDKGYWLSRTRYTRETNESEEKILYSIKRELISDALTAKSLLDKYEELKSFVVIRKGAIFTI